MSGGQLGEKWGMFVACMYVGGRVFRAVTMASKKALGQERTIVTRKL